MQYASNNHSVNSAILFECLKQIHTGMFHNMPTLVKYVLSIFEKFSIITK
jgi:hypothetical protein